MSRVWLVALLVTAAACASSARVARLERRLATAEATQAKSDFELRASQTRIEQLLERLAGAASASVGDASVGDLVGAAGAAWDARLRALVGAEAHGAACV